MPALLRRLQSIRTDDMLKILFKAAFRKRWKESRAGSF